MHHASTCYLHVNVVNSVLQSTQVPMTTTFVSKLVQISGTAAIGWLLAKWMTAKRVARGITSCPPQGAVDLFHPFRLLGLALGSRYPFKGQMGSFYAYFSHMVYKKYGSTCLASATFWDAQPTYWFADADALKAITSDRFTFTKDMEAYEGLSMYGPNMLSLEGSEWKRHRDIAKSAFNEANNAFVWHETIRVVNEWFSQIDARATAASHQQITTQIDLLRDLTRATLLVIGSAGFGRHSTWLEDANSAPPPGHKVAFSPAVLSVIEHIFHPVLTPRFIWNAVTERGIHLPLIGPMILGAKGAFDNLRGHMLEVASQARDRLDVNRQARTEDNNGTHDAALLKNMVKANMAFAQKGEGEAEHKSLTDEELFSNMFLFFIAGHDTSSHTLCFVFVYLALYPEYQQRVFEEIFKMYPDGIPREAPSPAYRDILRQLEFTWAFFHETLRLLPAVVRLGKITQTDTSMKSRRFSTSPEGKMVVTQEVDILVPKGALCLLDITALHRNPIHWGDDAENFRPERFIDTEGYTWPRDAFLGFSAGPRGCIGQRFATTESICIIASVVRRYEILLPEDVLGLDFEEQMRKLTRWKPSVTNIPTNARVRFRKRGV